MRKLIKYIVKSLPLCAGLIVLLHASLAHAGFLGDLWDKLVDTAIDAAGKTAALALGINTEDNCPVPTTADSDCMFCQMFKILFNAGSDVAKKSYDAFSSDLGQLVVTFLAVSLALIVLRNIATMGAKDPGALLNDLLKKAFLGAVIYIIIAKDYYNVINLTLTPVFKTGMGFVLSGSTTCGSAANVHGYVSTAGGGNSSGGLPMDVGTSIICAVEDIEKKIGMLFEFGEWAFCRGNGPDRIFHILPNIIYLIDGLILYFAGILFMVAYPWIMGDAVLQLGIAMALAPFAICGYAFSGTKQYLSKVWSWILNSLFTFMFMAILLMCILGYIEEELLSALSTAEGDPKKFFLLPNGIAFYGWRMLKIIFFLFIGWAYMPTISDLAGKFADGSGLSAAGAVGKKITDSVDNKTSQAANWAAGAAGNAAISSAKATARRARAGVRQGIMLGVNTFGKSNGTGGKRIKVLGFKFETQKDANGKQVLRREFKSITGRKHVMVSDKYSTIRQEFDRSGKEIKNEVEFKYAFVNKYLMEKDGTVNIGAVQTLLNSPMAQRPAYKKAIMAQLAVEIAKKKGKDVQKYYRSRNIVFDPADPYNIQIEQVDQTGKFTTLGIKIDAATGQVAINYHKERSRNRYEKIIPNANKARKKLGRRININLVAMNIKKAGHENIDGSHTWDSLGHLVSYTTKKDADGHDIYEREARKYLFFGKKIKKTYSRDGVELEINSDAGIKAQTKHDEKLLKLEDQIMNHNPVANADGGYTQTDSRNITASHIDPTTGEKYYTVTENKGFWRKAYDPTIKTTTYYKDKIVTEIKTKKGKVISKNTKFIRKFGDESKTVRKDVEGNRYETDNISGSTHNNEKFTGEYENYFDNGLVEIRSTGLSTDGNILKGTARTAGEKTTFKYSEKAQAGHDSILSALDGNQVVEKNGKVAADLDPANAGMAGYKGNLTFGMDNIAGLSHINGMSMQDFIVKDILAEGRQKKTNRLRTNIDWGRNFLYVADEVGNIIGKADKSTGQVVSSSGTGMGTIGSDGNLYDISGRIIGHLI